MNKGYDHLMVVAICCRCFVAAPSAPKVDASGCTSGVTSMGVSNIGERALSPNMTSLRNKNASEDVSGK